MRSQRRARVWDRRLPGALSRTQFRVYYGFQIASCRCTGRGADPLIPPNSLHSAGSLGSADYVAAGEEFFRYFVDLCELKPDDRVLDVGSGTGRIGRCGNELLLDFRSGLSLPFSLIIEYTRTQPHHRCDPTPQMYAKWAR